MKKYNLKNFTRGWIIGDFEPSIIRTRNFEFMVRNYIAGEIEQRHTHKIADEITVVVSGKFKMNDDMFGPGDIIHLSPGDSSEFKCLEDGTTSVIKTPSVIGDKYFIN